MQTRGQSREIFAKPRQALHHSCIEAVLKHRTGAGPNSSLPRDAATPLSPRLWALRPPPRRSRGARLGGRRAQLPGLARRSEGLEGPRGAGRRGCRLKSAQFRFSTRQAIRHDAVPIPSGHGVRDCARLGWCRDEGVGSRWEASRVISTRKWLDGFRGECLKASRV